MADMKKMGRIAAIKAYFEDVAHKVHGKWGRKVEMAEFKAFTPEERLEVAEMCAAELGVELEQKPV